MIQCYRKYSINERYTNSSQHRAIREAMRVIDAGGSVHKHLKEKGWAGPKRGVYKWAYIKNGIVVKSGPPHQLRHEVNLWKKTRYGKFRRYRRNVARVFGIYKGWLFQRKVLRPAKTNGDQLWPKNQCKESSCSRIAYALGIDDWYDHNHYHDKKGRPIWFDTTAR